MFDSINLQNVPNLFALFESYLNAGYDENMHWTDIPKDGQEELLKALFKDMDYEFYEIISDDIEKSMKMIQSLILGHVSASERKLLCRDILNYNNQILTQCLEDTKAYLNALQEQSMREENPSIRSESELELDSMRADYDRTRG